MGCGLSGSLLVMHQIPSVATIRGTLGGLSEILALLLLFDGGGSSKIFHARQVPGFRDRQHLLMQVKVRSKCHQLGWRPTS